MKKGLIIIGIIVLVVAAFLVFGKDKTTATTGDGTAGNGNASGGGIFGINFGKDFGVLRQPGQSFSDWFAGRKADSFAFDTRLI